MLVSKSSGFSGPGLGIWNPFVVPQPDIWGRLAQGDRMAKGRGEVQGSGGKLNSLDKPLFHPPHLGVVPASSLR